MEASKIAAIKNEDGFMATAFYFFAVHKWTFTQAFSVLLTLPLLGDLPEGVAGMGFLTFLFACWKQWETTKMAKREIKMREEWHQERIKTVKMLRAGRLNLDKEILREILGD